MLHVAADHHRHEAVTIDILGLHAGDELAVLEYGHPVTNLKYLLKAVGDIDDGDAVPLESIQSLEEQIDFVARNDRRRLVKDKQPDLVDHCPGDFDHLLVGHAQFADVGARIDIDPQTVKQFPGVASALRVVDQSERPSSFVAYEDVFGHRQMREEHELLIDDMYARVLGGGWRLPAHDFAIEFDLTLIWLMDSGDDLRES